MIRDATTEDAPAVRALVAGLALRGPLDDAVVDDHLRRALADDRSVLLVAEDGDAVIGYLLGVLAPMMVHGGLALVQELAVREDHRRTGAGAALVRHFEERAGTAGASVVSLATSRAGEFYAALGYVPTATYYRRELH
ncbi:GNAT family N-acetyltransferase [Cellulomonas sp. DKR-3]|uniref:GNAT family N-acetyltransferase n=1 Tax=Cellulomonas fulva TaxID=2835530 RepID=A0ABS5TX98_9CELL|nr:GNAT family N-acetyltransferase [Cellulomonas fulva]MBT0993779.1 GNAT family N-acetyltransferase [Cellulomonas fulva]